MYGCVQAIEVFLFLSLPISISMHTRMIHFIGFGDHFRSGEDRFL